MLKTQFILMSLIGIGDHFYCPVCIGGQVKSLLSQSLDKVFNHYQFTETINEEPKALTTENLGSVEYIYDILMYTNNKPPYHKVVFQVIWTVKFDEQEISKRPHKGFQGFITPHKWKVHSEETSRFG